MNPLSPRWPIGDPSPAIAGLAPIGRALLSPVGGTAIAILIGLALITGWQHWHALSGEIGSSMSSVRFWLITWCMYPLIKAIHELAHGIVLRHFGGRTPVFGISLLMFMPAPYVDASETDQLASGRQRALVSMAGIMAEVILAAIAIIIWAWLSDGLLREILLSVALIGSVSTLAFNANPLIRLDGYYALADFAELPNLAERSRLFWQREMQGRILGMPSRALSVAQGERPWLLAYAPASWLYRIGIMVWLASWLGHYSRVAGLTILLGTVVTLVLLPLSRLVKAPRQAGLPLTQVSLAHTRFVLTLFAVLTLSLIPVPDRTLVQAVTWSPDGTRIRANQTGFIESVKAADGDMVAPGQQLLQLKDPKLDAEVRAQLAHITGLENEWQDELGNATAQMTGRRETLAQAYRRLDHLQQNQARLTIYAEVAGRFRLDQPTEDLPGRFVKAGELLGYVETDQALRLRAVLTETQANELRARAQADLVAQVSGGNGLNHLGSATVLSLSPDAIDSLPSDALATQAGGPIKVKRDKPQQLDRAYSKVPLHPSYQLDLQLHPDSQPSRDSSLNRRQSKALAMVPGQRVWIRLDLGWRPILSQLVESAGQAFNASMAPGWS